MLRVVRSLLRRLYDLLLAMIWLRLGSPRRHAGFRGVPWMPCARIPRFKSYLMLVTLGDGRSISINAKSDDNFNVGILASSLNKPTTGIKLIANGTDLATSEGYSINYLWSKNNMQPTNILDVEATDEYGGKHIATAIIPKP